MMNKANFTHFLARLMVSERIEFKYRMNIILNEIDKPKGSNKFNSRLHYLHSGDHFIVDELVAGLDT